MYVALFYARLKPEHDRAVYAALGQRMAELAAGMPGFVDLHKVDLADGRELAIAYFDSEEHMQAWYLHPEHREAQRAGRDTFLDDYLIEVCEVKRAYTKASSHFDNDPNDTRGAG